MALTKKPVIYHQFGILRMPIDSYPLLWSPQVQNLEKEISETNLQIFDFVILVVISLNIMWIIIMDDNMVF